MMPLEQGLVISVKVEAWIPVAGVQASRLHAQQQPDSDDQGFCSITSLLIDIPLMDIGTVIIQ